VAVSASRWPAPYAQDAPGSGLALLVNANAKRGGRRVAAQITRALPGASVRLTKSTEEIEAWLRVLPPSRGVLGAGGDGTAVALLNALDRVTALNAPLPTTGILPLGTGNGWANALGAPKLHRCLALLGRSTAALPTRSFGLVEVDGSLAHFAGSGWDAMILEDYKRQLQATRGPGRRLSRSIYGYVVAALLRTTPKVALLGNPHLLIENLGDDVYVLNEEGTPYRLRHAGYGSVLYDGPAGAASVGTCPEYGYRFKAFPFAERMPGFMSVRVYARSPLGAVASMGRLWRGAHPLVGMHDWLAVAVRMTFSRPVPLQVAGDAHGLRQTIEYRCSRRIARMVDWKRLYL